MKNCDILILLYFWSSRWLQIPFIDHDNRGTIGVYFLYFSTPLALWM